MSARVARINDIKRQIVQRQAAGLATPLLDVWRDFFAHISDDHYDALRDARGNFAIMDAVSDVLRLQLEAKRRREGGRGLRMCREIVGR